MKSTLKRKIFAQVTVKYIEINLNTTKPGYSEYILPVPWPFIKSRFYSISSFLILLLCIIHAFPLTFYLSVKTDNVD